MAEFELNPLEREFLEASRESHAREEREARARVRRLRILAAAAGTLAVVALIVGGVAALQWRKASDAQDDAEQARDRAENAAVEATLARLETEVPLLVNTNRSLAFGLAAEAYKLAPGSRTISLLNRVFSEDPRWLGRLWPAEPPIGVYSVSDDGRYVAIRDVSGAIELLDAATHARISRAPMEETEPSTSGQAASVLGNAYVAFLPDGTLLDVATPAIGEPHIRVRAVPSLRVVREFTYDPNAESISGYSTSSALVPFFGPVPQGCCRRVRLLDVQDGSERIVSLPDLDFGSPFSRNTTFDATGSYAAVWFRTAAGTLAVAMLDAKTFELITTILPTGDQISWFGFSPDGKVFVTAYTVGNVQAWDSRSGALLGAAKFNNFFPGSVFIGPSGHRVVVAIDNQKIAAVSVPELKVIEAPITVTSTGFELSFLGAEERTLFSGSVGNLELEQWSLDGTGLVVRYSFEPGPGTAAESPDGKWFIKQALDGTWTRWGLPGLEFLNRSTASFGATANDLGLVPVAPRASPDGRYVATAHTDCPPGPQSRCSSRVVLWDATTGEPVGDPILIPNPGDRGPGVEMSFHPTLPLLAVAGPGSLVQIWTFAGGELARVTSFTVPVAGQAATLTDLAFVAPVNGTQTVVAVSPELGVLSLWDVGSEPAVQIGSGKFPVLGTIGVTPGGSIVIQQGHDIAFYDVESFGGSATANPFRVLPAASEGAGSPRLSFSADGRWMSVAQDATAARRVSVWDLQTNELVGANFNWLQSSGVGPDSAFMSPDGSYVVSSSDGATVVWSLDTSLWAEKACFAAGRNLTAAEWTKYFPSRDYEVTCPQWPAKPNT